MSSFECKICGQSFTVASQTLAKYPSWKPQRCMPCRKSAQNADSSVAGRRASPARSRAPKLKSSATKERDLTLAEVLATYTDGPMTGVFTDGAAHPNPGAGGWGAVYVVNNEIIAQAKGAAPSTTNNRMELTALIEGYGLVPKGSGASVFTDSKLCVDTINQWAAGWKRNGWKRKGGAIKNLDLVQRLYACSQARPDIELSWIKAHSGNRWNEFADALSTAYRRDRL